METIEQKLNHAANDANEWNVENIYKESGYLFAEYVHDCGMRLVFSNR